MDADLVGLGWSPRTCISNKLSGDADTVGPWTTLRSKKSEDKCEQFSKEMVKEIQMVKEKLKSKLRAIMELLHIEEENRGDREKIKLHVCFNFRKNYEFNLSYLYKKHKYHRI